ncbi:seleno S-like isoform X1 [Labeo rohita]|uniref:Seleno S-like isoform X1 n=1 Tax=Labeo rohita TaxID=84645 RepID=A0A498NZJ9_LABRO|nr:seleno S-like isoform X1 [Labeo rohita]RXN37722.1 seleno S-like isoform X1 [Labeo rohita]
MEAQDGARVRNEDVPPQNQDLSFLLPSAFLSEYGWYVVFVCVGVYLLIQHLRKNRSTDSRSSPVSTTNQDPESVVRRQAALEASRRRMQEEQDARAAEFRERQQRLEEEKRRQKIEMWDSMKEGKSYKGKLQVAEDTVLCLETEEEHAPGDPAGEARPRADEVKGRKTDFTVPS